MNAPDYMASCAGKESMPATDAKRAAKRIRKAGRGNTEAYRCSICGHWHVGSNPVGKRRLNK